MTAPAALADLVATSISAGQINLSWTSPGGGTVTGYNVYRGTTPLGEDYSSPINGGTLVTSSAAYAYSDTGLTAGVTYYYTVEAVNASGSGVRPPTRPPR